MLFNYNNSTTEICSLGPPAPLPPRLLENQLCVHVPGASSPGPWLAWGRWYIQVQPEDETRRGPCVCIPESGVSVRKMMLNIFKLALPSPVFPLQNCLPLPL